ncbi:MAG: hypothetical protein J0I47_03645 [Sphingomonas sp.]|uniref:hypothetical protein n=1 Tax=Sphingomonas sp. TaxID=28214 RepID=UPI001AC386E5|nr:hypothetical protein [Sphingomonas sp.]MBN8807319.1 hypothetical protein [Sphingomonas sp.]
MGWAEMTVVIVAIVMIGRVLKARYDQQDRSDTAEEIETRRAEEEVRQLKERIAVLERVITDTNGASNLDREIEALRDGNRDRGPTGR